MDAVIIDYLIQLRDLLDDTIKRYQERSEKVNKWHANDAMEDCMVIHNRINRVHERAGAYSGQ